jgi:DNA-binding NarL/FixJ family response regulator
MRVLIVEDHPLVARTMAELVQALMVGCATQTLGDFAQAEQALRGDRGFGAVLLDLMIPGGSGPPSLRALVAAAPETRFVVVSGIDDPAVMRACWDAGAVGYIRKADPEELQIRALRTVLLDKGVSFPQEAIDARTPAAEPLTPREREVLDALLRTGQGNKGLARALGIEPATIKTHVTNLLRKTGVRTRAELLAQARGGWLQ